MLLINTTVAAVIGLATVTNCHMEMKSPPPFRSKYNPYSGSDIDYSMTSPLSGSGSDYPCKGYQKLLDGPEGRSVVTWASGGSYNFTITGSANHGGGSCQASLSYDNGHTWKVIHSYIGGCPPPQDSSWSFTVPSDAPAGDAMFAWTWFNNIGNREMYMNCAAVTIVNGKKRLSFAPFASHPAAFIANIGNNICTYEHKDVEFPQPGPEVERNSQGTSPPGQGTCSGPPPAPPPVVDLASSETSSSTFITPQLPATSSRAAHFTSSVTSKSAILTSISSTGQPPAATISQQQQQKSSAPAVPHSSSSTAPQPLGSNCGSGYCPSNHYTFSLKVVGSACAVEGQWNCAADGKHFQRCASGFWSASIPMAAGTLCQLGTSDSFILVDY
ncbi:hypothetical protein V8C42DRAFT_336838 [Trichoderma barbatum]